MRFVISLISGLMFASAAQAQTIYPTFKDLSFGSPYTSVLTTLEQSYPFSTVATPNGAFPQVLGGPVYLWGDNPQSDHTNPGQFQVLNGPILSYVPQTYGEFYRGVAGSIIAGCSDPRPQITGLPNDTDQAVYNSRDSAALFVENCGDPALITTAATYDATHLYPSPALTSTQVSELRVGMYVDAVPSGQTPPALTTRYMGIITGWAQDGSSVTVSGWYVTGNQSSGQVPTAGSTSYFAIANGIDGVNIVNHLEAGSYPTAMDNELDNTNDEYEPTSLSNQLWGMDMESGGAYDLVYAYNARDHWIDGFNCGISPTTAPSGFDNACFISGPSSAVSYGARFGGSPSKGDILIQENSSPYAIVVNNSGSNQYTLDHQGNIFGNSLSTGIVYVGKNLAAGLAAGEINFGQNYSGSQAEVDITNPSSSASTTFSVWQNTGSSYLNVMNVSPAGIVFSKSGYNVDGTNGVSCSAGSVSLTTLTVSGGIVTHC